MDAAFHSVLPRAQSRRSTLARAPALPAVGSPAIAEGNGDGGSPSEPLEVPLAVFMEAGQQSGHSMAPALPPIAEHGATRGGGAMQGEPGPAAAAAAAAAAVPAAVAAAPAGQLGTLFEDQQFGSEPGQAPVERALQQST